MMTRRSSRLMPLQMTAAVLIVYFMANWVWINMTLPRSQLVLNAVPPEEVLEVRAAVTDRELSLEDDHELQAALSSIEKDPVVNPHPYPYRISNDRFCSNDVIDSSSPLTKPHHGNPFLLVYVHTAPQNYAKRLLLRQTWARPELYRPDFDIRIVYFMGRRRDDPVLDQAIELEAAQFGDIIQSDFDDSYRNLTHKAVAALRWISSFCNRTRYVLKTDDDAFVNMRALLKHLSDIDGRQSGGQVQQLAGRSDGHPRRTSPPRRLIMCRVWQSMQVLRNDTKWGVSRLDFAPDFYPDYCSGIALVMTVDVVVALSRVAPHVKYFWIDDVFLTGLLPERLSRAGLRVRWAQFGHAYIRMDKMETFDSPLWYRYLFVHLADMRYFARMWTKMEAAAQLHPIPEVERVEPGYIAGHGSRTP